MNKWKKGLGLFLTAAMLVGSMAGCGANEEPEKESSQAGNASQEVSSQASSSVAEETPDEIPTYRVLIVRTSTRPTDYLEAEVYAELEEKHGINIEWEVYKHEDWTEQKALLLASGELPDAFLGSNTLTDADIEQNKSYFVELTDYDI